MTDPILSTPRLTLRMPRPGDLQGLFSIYGTPAAMRYWSTPPHSLDDTRAFLDTYLERSAERPSYFIFEHKGRVIGTGGLHSGTEVGYILHPDFWRQGFVTEGMSAIIPYVFDTWDLPKLTADIDPRNHASAASLRRLGFEKTGSARNTFCVAGEWSDSWYYTLWRDQRPS